MSKIAEKLPQEMIAAIAAMFGSEAAGTTAAKPQIEDRPIAKGSGFNLIRLLNSKQYDGEAAVFAEDGEAVLFEDDSQVTFGDLATVENVRPDGSAGRHYPVIWGLTQRQAVGATNYLLSMSDKPKQASAGRGQRSKTSGKAGSSDNLGAVEALLRQLLAEVRPEPQPAKPVPAAGHRMVKQSATPTGANVVDLAPGQIVRINGELRQVAADGKRLNKTIV